jgi:Flp pilus assembly protein TadG
MTAMRRRRPHRGEAGNALVEVSITLPLLFLLILGATDLARVFYTAIELTNAARAGAQFGAASLGNSGNIAGMQNEATNAVNMSGVTATASRLCQCASDTGTFSATSPSANDCTVAPATACPANSDRVITVTVTTTKSFSTIASVPGFASPMSLTRTATLRVSE